ncbi:lipid IV(A) 3-deoxy-D-manno-octulosonic acid transferase [bacterium AH-315-K03]|nr:lipid IV(A) 3-deoxy-D-manno-octulosonic acid transferase [bacterium AH-315-K03]
MARRLYCIFFYLILPLILLRLCYRASKSSAYSQRIAERFAYFKRPDFDDAIWVHAVSVGETIAAAPLIKRLQQQFPATPVVITTMTPTGSARVNALFGDSVFHVYAPYDLPGSVKRFLRKVRPKLLVIMETELWPNTLHYCRKNNVPIVLANARLSERSAKGYQRLSSLSRAMLQNVSMVAAQNKEDAERFITLGLPEKNCKVTGSIKFDIRLDKSLKASAAELKSSWSAQGSRLIWVAASTHEGEDELLLAAFKILLKSYAQLLLVLVPRHPERFDKVVTLCQREGLNTVRRSDVNAPGLDTQVLVGDTMGELLLFYGCADIALVGGSLVTHGGHNVLEPAAWGVPIITGQSDFNFSEINRLLLQATGLKKINDADELAGYLLDLVKSESLRKQVGDAARSVVVSNRGALDRLMVLLGFYL